MAKNKQDETVLGESGLPVTPPVDETSIPPVVDPKPPVDESKNKPAEKEKEKVKKEEPVVQLKSPIPSSKDLIDYAFATNDKTQLLVDLIELQEAINRIKIYMKFN